MVQLLAKWWIKDCDNYQSPKVRQAYGVLCGAVGIALNLILFAGKFLAGTISRSIAITADAFNNLSDAGSSLIMLIGFRMAGQKPDPDHPFGHGRIEYLAGLMVSLAILLMGVELIKSSIDKIRHPEDIAFSYTVVAILVVSILVKLYMYIYNHSIGKKLASATMTATATDSISDTCATLVVLIATLVSHFTGVLIDGYCGVLVGAFICYAGFSAIKDTINPLLGQPAEPEFVEAIEKIVMSYDEIQGMHDLVVHDYGPGRVMISLHAEVPAHGDIMELHDIIDNAEAHLKRELSCEAVIHMDPICTEDAQTNEWKNHLQMYLSEIDQILSLHDFRIVQGPTHTNLIFDVVVPYGYGMTDDEVLKKLEDKVKAEYPNVYLVVTVDHSYSR